MPTTEANVRRLALALPEAYEDLHRGKPTFRVNRRIFAMLRGETRAERSGMFAALEGERPVVLLKLDREDQINLAEGYPSAVTPAEYAHNGWTHLWLDAADAALLATVIRLAWVNVAPKRLSRRHV